ncbi:hypothetical protein CDL15_Pgr008631 [Punica granatum]|uniref:Uncharacterized protein n=1 Tax=Punica granatum TaxID=22663 RepID=A0A218XDE1_PUNGR|nr:hypothetical protein CDL15_Pgr008631 [Punica granatum]
MQMTGSVPVSFAGVTYYGNLRANFNQGVTSLAEDVLARASTGDALVYVAWKWSSWVDDVRGGLSVNVERECPDLHC